MNFFNSYKSNLFLNLILVYIIWGSTYMGVKIGLNDLSPLLLTGLRFFIGGVILFVLILFLKKLPTLEEAKGSMLIGLLLTGFGTSSLAYAIQFLPSGLVALLVALLPIWMFLLDFLFFSKTKPSILSGSGMLIGLAGVLFLFNPFGLNGGINSTQISPIFIVFFSSLIWAFGSLMSTKTKQAKGIAGLSFQMLAGGTFAFLASMFLESNQIEEIQTMSSSTILSLTYLILIGSFIGYSAYIWLINNAPPILTSTYAFVNPVVAIIVGFYIANEVLDSSSIIASGLILLGVIFMTLGRRKKGEF
ncbi:EamA family transporter [Arcticibacterium luteifluviistationis]|uniref:EamA family transporter n=1 Tax=Arcticibacterium luteifluviistationis TaxID=1784714 RepID=A0A2Z4G8G8_9BACT|nr:EamA family transporter [Arcticibacterium luteifluviistationis]AWV97434.1 EamA family transporter [Arcticibacterium luteifluviistationis]